MNLKSTETAYETTRPAISSETLILLCACSVGFAFSCNYTNHAPLVPLLIKEFGVTKAMAGLLTTGIFLTHALMQIPGGHLADTYGGRRVLLGALGVVCLGNFGISFATSYNQLLFWKVLTGLGTGSSFVAGARYLTQVLPANRLHMAQGLYGGSVLLGSGFVIFAVPRLAEAFGWPGAFISTALVALSVLLLCLFAAPEAPVHKHAPGSLLAMLSHGQLWLLGLVQMASFGLVIVVGTWTTTLLKEQLGEKPETKLLISFIASLVLLIGIFSRPWGGRLVGTLGVRKLLLISLAMNATGCFLLASSGSSLAVAILGIALLGVGCGLPYASLFNRAVALFPGRGGAAMGLVNMLGIVMILVGAPLVGKITDLTGSFTSAFVSLGIFALIICVVSLKINDK
ncbi:MFS transporter [Fibrella forsythiae]|uniref:MFS transporter n=1 Tax=Fibrella forsythiae TaxID=2817061 RepID=A0ABS3JFC6_9BACT|nr:MFS transporter [Fibrella forsythiae]MBO0948709.1 MFS transporter [Fibrella forsythiae]